MKFKKAMIWIFALLIVFLLVFNLVGYWLSVPRYKGPVSDHFNGKTFINPGNVKAKGLGDVIKWASSRKPAPWVENTALDYGEKPVERNTEGVIITFVTHSTFLIKVDVRNILPDPIWSERPSPVSFLGPKRMRPPGLRFEDLPPIDLVLLSHNHYDHLDLPTIKKLIKIHDPQFISPLGVGAFVRSLGTQKVEDIDWWQEKQLHVGFVVAAVPAQHFSGRGTFDRDATLWCGYVLVREQGNIYFAGDSGYGDFFKSSGERYG